jgi:hypothetical protein
MLRYFPRPLPVVLQSAEMDVGSRVVWYAEQAAEVWSSGALLRMATGVWSLRNMEVRRRRTANARILAARQWPRAPRLENGERDLPTRSLPTRITEGGNASGSSQAQPK